jgi:hypothetical protein
MISRDDLLQRLLEPYRSLSETEIAEALVLAQSDAEVARALDECRRLDALREAEIFPASGTSDADFLVALRGRLATAQTPLRGTLFGSRRLVPIAATLCIGLMALILSTGPSDRDAGIAEQSDQNLETFATALDVSSTMQLDSLQAMDADPESLATYLDVGDMAQSWDFDDSNTSDEPLSDALLSLDTQSIEEVLNKLEATNFF